MKKNLLLGTASGKLGDIVLYRDNGQQQARTRVTPKNPRTFLQALHRVLIATASQAYSRLADIANHSTEGAVGSRANMRAFIQRCLANFESRLESSNLSLVGTLGNFRPRGFQDLYANVFPLSYGTLPSVRLVQAVNNNVGAYLALNTAPTIGMTWAELADSLGVPAGAQLTFVSMNYDDTWCVTSVTYKRLVLTDPAGRVDTPCFKAGTSEGSFILNESNPLSTLASSSVTYSLENQFALVVRDFYDEASDYIDAAIITSIYDNGWKRSTEVIGSAFSGSHATHTINDAILSYMDGDPKSDKYLNQAHAMLEDGWKSYLNS